MLQETPTNFASQCQPPKLHRHDRKLPHQQHHCLRIQLHLLRLTLHNLLNNLLPLLLFRLPPSLHHRYRTPLVHPFILPPFTQTRQGRHHHNLRNNGYSAHFFFATLLFKTESDIERGTGSDGIGRGGESKPE